MNDDDLVRRTVSGDVDAYAGIVRAYQAKVFGLCCSFLENRSEAEDAAQEVFVKAYGAIGSFRGNSSFSTWLYRIAANHCKDLLRKRSRRPVESFDRLKEEMGEAAEGLLKSAPPAGLSAENEERLEEVLGGLSADERLILSLREAEGLSYLEISQVLQCTVDAVKARLKRARAALAERARHFLPSKDV